VKPALRRKVLRGLTTDRMKWNLQAACPICAKTFLRVELHAHIVTETPGLRREIMESIRERHPDWTHERGACSFCWEVFRQMHAVQMG